MKNKATLIGTFAIAMWSMLALTTSATKGIPPFQLLFLTFAIGGTIGLIMVNMKQKQYFNIFRIPIKAWVVGVGGLFGYHFFYFTALSNAPVAEASLIAYFWPVLIVLFSSFLPDERLMWFHIFGAFIALSGAVILLMNNGEFSISTEYVWGYLAALCSALIWAIYSVLNRTMAHIPTDCIAGFCIITAILGGISHMALEQWVSPIGWQWLAIFGLGIGPVGAAFYAWDYGTKHGNIKLLGVSSYAAPLISTIILTLTGKAEFTWGLAAACFLISCGALLASLDMFTEK